PYAPALHADRAPRARSIPGESERALDLRIGAYSCRRTGVHFAGICASGAHHTQSTLRSELGAIGAQPTDLFGFLWDNMGTFGRQWNERRPPSNYLCGRSM